MSITKSNVRRYEGIIQKKIDATGDGIFKNRKTWTPLLKELEELEKSIKSEYDFLPLNKKNQTKANKIIYKIRKKLKRKKYKGILYKLFKKKSSDVITTLNKIDTNIKINNKKRFTKNYNYIGKSSTLNEKIILNKIKYNKFLKSLVKQKTPKQSPEPETNTSTRASISTRSNTRISISTRTNINTNTNTDIDTSTITNIFTK